ncbi:hypothetical protein [Aeromonas cavernicola]|uniref:Uncharacterized protein n=1 Tax=Aeromonas cavernicola TaxID=1006623 RepID=A0A2H9U0F9_9GAMM|nr:hypothetical protein [Aeromonas cavernicola]PJG57501.1 hypothetical protein CUC53_17655 [Aeromonas cavernicola]
MTYAKKVNHAALASGAFERPRVDLTQLDQGWVNAGKAKGRVVDLTHNLNEAVYRELRLRYLHYSAYPKLFIARTGSTVSSDG